MEKLAEKRVIRDPIHGYIHIEDKVIWDLINSKEFQRLRRVRQLGSTLMVFPSGEHSRMMHSLGAYEIARRMINEVDDIRNTLTEREKMVLMVAALLHDIGHAPFSHSFESILSCKHELYTAQIITGPSEVADVLRSIDQNLPEEVASVIDHTHPNPILSQLISSQLDADRLDYLLRDSYFTGVSYGQIDLDRILRTMRVKDNKVVVKRSSIYTVENYIMARYHMYWQVYYHPNSRSYDTLLKSIFTRLRDLYSENEEILEKYPMYRELLTKKRLSNEEMYLLDDSTCIYSFSLMRRSDDPVLKDLASRILDRKLFEYMSADREEYLINECKKKGYDPRYYVVKDHQKQIPYLPYTGDGSDNIYVLMDNGTIEELSNVSQVVKSLSTIDEQDERVFYPKEIEL
ncbi:MAG: HD domain-containing protein [Erysipelotrichaceae bacterium]|nr:HD domain-containing protein [Erysipelotrichaceae bacterium]